jgi:hypothetical protein
MKILGERWKQISPEEKGLWKDEADKLNAIERQKLSNAEGPSSQVDE